MPTRADWELVQRLLAQNKIGSQALQEVVYRHWELEAQGFPSPLAQFLVIRGYLRPDDVIAAPDPSAVGVPDAVTGGDVGPRLVELLDGADARVISLARESISLGRSRDTDVQLRDKRLSRKHARIDRTPQGHVYSDLGSRVGSRINGTPVHGAVLLQPGDRIELGSEVYRFEGAGGSGRPDASGGPGVVAPVPSPRSSAPTPNASGSRTPRPAAAATPAQPPAPAPLPAYAAHAATPAAVPSQRIPAAPPPAAVAACPACATPTLPGDKFCGGCGRPMGG